MVEYALQSFTEKHKIIARACHSAPLERLSAGPSVPFVSPVPAKRADPAAILPGVKSIIVIGAGWGIMVSGKTPSVPAGLGQLSSLGTNYDYHFRIKKLLRSLADELKTVCGDFRYKILVDSPFLDERAFAHRAGLGFYGRNGLIISPEFGSRFNIGLLLTSLPLSENPENPVSACPADCRLCVDACPSNALKNGRFEASSCVSYLTQKDELSPDEEALIGRQLYGCDICQDVCPLNAPKESAYIDPKTWLAMSDKDFESEYGHTAMLWRGTEILRRNARCILSGALLI